MKNSKQKGNNFERKVAKILTEKLEMEFNRTPQSGGLRWASDNNVYGDIVTPNNFPFIIECKNRENWSFDQLMKGQCKEFDNWVKQVTEDCCRYNHNSGDKDTILKVPLIIFTKNRMPIYLAYDYGATNYKEDEVIEKLIKSTSCLCYYNDWRICKMEENK